MNKNGLNDVDRKLDNTISNKYRDPVIYNFTVPLTDPENACIRMETSFLFKAKYLASNQVNFFTNFKI